MSAPSTTVVQINVKSPAGTLLNIYAENVTEAKEIAEAVIEDLAATVAALEQTLGATSQVARAIPLAPTQPQGSTAPDPATPSAGSSPVCDCGLPMKLIPAGVSKAGRPYKAFYACAQPRGQQCDKKISG